MHHYCWSFVYLLFVPYLLLITIGWSKAEECLRVPDTEQALLVQDFGPDGVRGPLNVTIANNLQPGAIISVVTKSETRGSVNLIADDIYVLHVDARILLNQLVLATSKRLNVDWHEILTLPNPVTKNTKHTTSLLYDTDGYRIYINGKKVAFYVHKTNKLPRVLNLQHDYVYKVMYLTNKEIGKA